MTNENDITLSLMSIINLNFLLFLDLNHNLLTFYFRLGRFKFNFKQIFKLLSDFFGLIALYYTISSLSKDILRLICSVIKFIQKTINWYEEVFVYIARDVKNLSKRNWVVEERIEENEETKKIILSRMSFYGVALELDLWITWISSVMFRRFFFADWEFFNFA